MPTTLLWPMPVTTATPTPALSPTEAMSTPMLSVDTMDTDMPVTTLARDLLRPPLTLMPMPTMVTTAYLPTLTATDTVSDTADTVSDTADTVTVTVMLTTVKHYPTSNLIHNH